MIDWYLVLFGGLWIFGLSLALATLGMARYTALELNQSLRTTLAVPRFQIPLNTAMLLFCLGLVGSADTLWERALWLLLALLFAGQVWSAWRQRRVSEREG